MGINPFTTVVWPWSTNLPAWLYLKSSIQCLDLGDTYSIHAKELKKFWENFNILDKQKSFDLWQALFSLSSFSLRPTIKPVQYTQSNLLKLIAATITDRTSRWQSLEDRKHSEIHIHLVLPNGYLPIGISPESGSYNDLHRPMQESGTPEAVGTWKIKSQKKNSREVIVLISKPLADLASF